MNEEDFENMFLPEDDEEKPDDEDDFRIQEDDLLNY